MLPDPSTPTRTQKSTALSSSPRGRGSGSGSGSNGRMTMHSFARLTMVCFLGLVLARACGFGAQMMEVLLLLAPEGTMKKKSNEEMDSEMPVHWCVLSDDVTPWPKKGKGAGGWFNHFPHASEVLLPCWSWFMDRGAQDRCGPPRSLREAFRQRLCDRAHFQSVWLAPQQFPL